MPTRIDRELTSGSDATLEFVLTDASDTALPLATDTVELFIAKGPNQAAHLKKTSAPGSHYNAAAGTVRFDFSPLDIPSRYVHQTWWYELWRTTSAGKRKPHMMGELQLLPSIRTS